MSQTRELLERQLQEAGRQLSAATISYHRRLAAQLGLNDTDHKCLDILLRQGSMTAGALAEISGYTTGAITGIVNRLAAKGLVARVADPSDARRVVLKADAAETHRRMWPLLQPMIHRMSQLHNSYSQTELKLALKYLQDCEHVLNDSAAELDLDSGKESGPRH